MKVSLLDVYAPGDNRDYNGGFGTTFEPGDSWRARFLSLARKKGEYFPLLNYGYLSAVLKRAGHEVSLDINRIRRDADLIVLHASLIRHREEREYLRRIRTETSSKVCLIGPLASVMPQLFESVADSVVVGDVESPFLEMQGVDDLPAGIITSPKIEALDDLPYPDWSIYDYANFSQYPILQRRPTSFIQGSRSCPYTCNYCPYVAGTTSYRIRKAENVVDELIHLKSRYGVRAVMFRDPTFSLNREWVIDLCSRIRKEDIDLEFGCETRTDRLDEELIDLMFSSGFRAIKIGVESINHAQLKAYKRHPPAIEHQERIVDYCEKKGIRIIAFYVLGLPEDTPETLAQTIRYSHKLNSSLANFTICTPIPGTEFYEQVKDRIFDHDLSHYDNFHPVYRLEHLSPEQLKRYQEKALTSFYFRYGFLKRHLKRMIRG